MIKKLVVIGFLISAFTGLGAQDAEKAANMNRLEKLIQEYKSIEKEVAAGSKTERDLDKVYADIQQKVKAKTYNARAFIIIYKAADKDYAAKEYDRCISKLKAIKDNYVYKAQSALQDKIQKAKGGQKEKLQKLLQDLSIKAADSAKVVGDCLFAKLNKLITSKGSDKDIETLGGDCVEAYADYIWSLGTKAQTVWAAKAYVPLLKTYKIMSKYDKEYYGEEYKRLFNGVIAKKKTGDNVWPILSLDANPESLPVIFEVFEYIISAEKNFSSGLKKHLKTLAAIPVNWDAKRYEGYTEEQHKSWFMQDQLHIEIGQLCLKLRAIEGLKKKDKEFLNKTGKAVVALVPTDSQKSNYAAKANELRQAYNLPVEIAERGFQKMIDGAMVFLYDPKQRDYDKARHYLNTLLAAAGPNSEARAKIWYWIAISYYREQRHQEAAFAFEKSQRTHPDWGPDSERKKGSQGLFGENAVKFMMNAADNHKSKLDKVSKALKDKGLRKASLENNRHYIQMMRKSFLEISSDKNEFYKELLPKIKFRYARDNFLTLQSDKEATPEQFNVPRTLMQTVPADSSNYVDALYYIFKCSFKSFDMAPESKAKLKAQLFDQASQDSNALFEKSKGSDNPNLAVYMADAQVTIIQLYLGQENPKYLKENVKLLENFKAKQDDYSKILGAKVIKRVPGWQIRNFVKLGDDASLISAYSIWKKWQAQVIALKAKDEKVFKMAFGPLLSSTQYLINKGYKLYLVDGNKKNPKYSDIKDHRRAIDKWFKKNVEFTPSLVLGFIVNAETPKEKAENCEIFMREWNKGWKEPGHKYHKEARGKMPEGYETKGPELGSTVVMVSKWELEALEAMATAESYKKAAIRYARFYEKINRRSIWLWKEADAMLNSAKQYKIKKKDAKALDMYKAAAAKYVALRKREEAKDNGKFSPKWWECFGKVIDCRMGQGDYTHIIKVYKSIRTKIEPDNDERRAWFKNCLEILKEEITANAPENATVWNSHVQDIINRLDTDKIENEQRKKEMEKRAKEIEEEIKAKQIKDEAEAKKKKSKAEPRAKKPSKKKPAKKTEETNSNDKTKKPEKTEN